MFLIPLLFILFAQTASGQSIGPDATSLESFTAELAAADIGRDMPPQLDFAWELEMVAPLRFVQPAMMEKQKFNWTGAINQSFYFLSLEHGARMFQAKTRAEFRGPQGWGDGDSKFTNYFAHPLQGAISGFIQIQNDPSGVDAGFGRSGKYWRSRFKALAWSAAYSTQFEIGLYSEAMLGNVGLKEGTGGYSDFVMTPVGGFGLLLAEDAVDRFLLSRSSLQAGKRAMFYRTVLNPSRSFANLLRLKVP